MGTISEPEEVEVVNNAFIPPPYACPYPVKVNPLWTKGLYADSLRTWLLELNVDKIYSPKMFEGLIDMDIAFYASRIYPTTDDWGLRWKSKYMLTLFVLDDIVDEEEAGRDPLRVVDDIVDFHLTMMWSFPDDPELRETLISILQSIGLPNGIDQHMKRIDEVLAQARTKPGTVYAGKMSIGCNVLRDTWANAFDRAAPESMLRLAYKTQKWLVGVVRETKYRKKATLPESVDTHIKLRRESAAVDGVLVSADFLAGTTCPMDWFKLEPMQRLIDAGSDVVACFNDIYSFRKEVLVEKNQDLFNIVRSISFHQNVSYQEAADLSTKMLDQMTADLEQAAADLRRLTPPELQDFCSIYIDAVRNICSATVDWHLVSPRYRQ